MVWLGFGIAICISSLQLSLGTLHQPGPGFLSFGAGAVMSLMALIVHLQSRWTLSTNEKASPFWKDRRQGLKMILTLLSLIVYAIVMEYLGFLLSTMLFLAFLFRAIKPQRWLVVGLGSILGSAASYCVFEIWLNSQLPKGIFWGN